MNNTLNIRYDSLDPDTVCMEDAVITWLFDHIDPDDQNDYLEAVYEWRTRTLAEEKAYREETHLIVLEQHHRYAAYCLMFKKPGASKSTHMRQLILLLDEDGQVVGLDDVERRVRALH